MFANLSGCFVGKGVDWKRNACTTRASLSVRTHKYYMEQHVLLKGREARA